MAAHGALMNEVDSFNVQKVQGTVKRTWPKKGFCFIAGDDGVDYFAHASNVMHGEDIYDAWVGRRCEFVPNEDPDKGPFATQISLAPIGS